MERVGAILVDQLDSVKFPEVDRLPAVNLNSIAEITGIDRPVIVPESRCGANREGIAQIAATRQLQVLRAGVVHRDGVDIDDSIRSRCIRLDLDRVNHSGLADDLQHVACARARAVDIHRRHGGRRRHKQREAVVAVQSLQRIALETVRQQRQLAVQRYAPNRRRHPIDLKLVARRCAQGHQGVRTALRGSPQGQRGAQSQVLVLNREQFVDPDHPFIASDTRSMDDGVIASRIEHGQGIIRSLAIVNQRLESAFARGVFVAAANRAGHHKALDQMNQRVIRSARAGRRVDAQGARFRRQRLVPHARRSRRFELKHIALVAGHRRRRPSRDPGVNVPGDRVATDRIRRRGPEHHIVVTRHRIDVQVDGRIRSLVVDPQDLDAVVDRRREVLVAVRRGKPQRIGQLRPSDDCDVVVAVGAHDHRTVESRHLSGFDVVVADPSIGADADPTLVRFGPGLEDHCPAAGEHIELVARRLTDRVAAVDEQRDRPGDHVERVVAFEAEDLQRLVADEGHDTVVARIVQVVDADAAGRDADVKGLRQRVSDHDQRVLARVQIDIHRCADGVPVINHRGHDVALHLAVLLHRQGAFDLA